MSHFADFVKATLTKNTKRRAKAIRALPKRQRSCKFVILDSKLFQASLVQTRIHGPSTVEASTSTQPILVRVELFYRSIGWVFEGRLSAIFCLSLSSKYRYAEIQSGQGGNYCRGKKREAPARIESRSEDIEEDLQPLKRNRPKPLASSLSPATSPLVQPSSLPAAPSTGSLQCLLSQYTPILPPSSTLTVAITSSTRSQERCPYLQRPSLDGLLGHRPEILLDLF